MVSASREQAVESASLIRPHMPELDTIRGIAVLMVLFFHGFFFRHGMHSLSGAAKLFVAATAPGWSGVNLFFVLSGFLITGILLDSKEKPHYYRRFYVRRALRILPLYYAVLVLLAVVAHIGLGIRNASWAFLGLSFVYLSNVTELFGVPMQYGVLWSLAVEEHFYLLWPAAVRRLSRRGVIAAAAALCVVCPGLRAFYFVEHYFTGTGYTWLVADGLATGAIIAALARGPWGTRRGMGRVGTVLFASGAGMLAVGLPFGIAQSSFLAGATLRETALNLLFGALITFTLLVGTSRWKALVNRRVLRFFGEISYGLYLIHMLVFDVEEYVLNRFFPGQLRADEGIGAMAWQFCLVAGVSVGICYLSRRYFEDYFLRMKKQF